MTKYNLMNNEKFKLIISTIMVTLMVMGVTGFTYTSINRETNVPVVVASSTIDYQTPSLDNPADNIYTTTTDLNIREGAGLQFQSFGLIEPNTSITVLWIENEEWAYCKEYKGYVNTNYLNKVPVEKVVGVAYTKNDLNPQLFSSPCETGDKENIERYTVYSIRPYLYNEDYYKVNGDKYISKNYVVVEYYEEEYFKRFHQNTNRGNVSRKALKPIINTAPNSISNLSLTDIQKMVAGTELDGIAESVHKIEYTHKVNALYTISVAMLESGNGTSYLARRQNNIFGLDPYNGGMTFVDKNECVSYFGRLTEKHYFNKGLTDLSSINNVYEPGNNQWQYLVRSIMKDNLKKIGKTI